MGAAYEAMCENEDLQSTLNNRNRKIREQKKLIIELAEGTLKHFDDSEWKSEEALVFLDRVEGVLAKLNKKKKK